MKLNNPPIKVTSEIILFLFECAKRGKVCSIEDVLYVINRTPSYVNKGIIFLEDNGILSRNDNKLTITREFMAKMGGSSELSIRIIREVLLDNKILIEYNYFLSKNRTKRETAKILKTIYHIENNEESIIKILDEWIEFLNIKISEEIPKNQTYDNLSASLSNKVVIGKFLKEEFGDYYSYISKDVLKDLTDSLLNIKDDSEMSINDIGRAIEDFLRIDLDSGLDLSKCQGIAQIANKFNQHNKFPTKLNNIAAGISSIRSMGKAHGVDKKENLRWSINEATAISTVILTISLMKAYLISIHENRLVF